MESSMKRRRSPSPSSLEESNAFSSPVEHTKKRSSSSSNWNMGISCTPFEARYIPSPPKAQKVLMSASEILFQSNCEAALKEMEPDLVYTVTKKEQSHLPTIFTASVSVRGKSFEAQNTHEAGAIARSAQLVLYYFILTKDPALKRLNVAEDEADPYAQFTENPMYTFTLIKPSVKINIVKTVGTPPFQIFTARVVIDGSNFEGAGTNPKAAQNEAARKALSYIISCGNRLRFYDVVWNPNPLRESSSASAIKPKIMETPVSALIRLKPGTQINIIKALGNPPNMMFTARVVVNGRGYYGTGPRKQEAKNDAARKAISSFNVEDQLKNQSQNIKEKIAELKRVKADLKGRLKGLKTQSTSNQKASKNSVLEQDRSKEPRTKKGKSNKMKDAFKTTSKGRMDHQYLKELDARNPTKNHKADGKQCEKEKRSKTAKNVIEPEELLNMPKKGLAITFEPIEKGGFDQYCKILEAETPIKNIEADMQVKPSGAVDTDPVPGGSSKEDAPFTEFGDLIAGMIENTFKSMKSADPSMPSHKILAGVVMTSGPKSKGCKVISVATGSKSISGVNLSLNGKSLNDCHAEVLARRGLVSFLYDQLESYSIHPEESIFEPARNGRLKIKNHILFHLYVNKAPCGSASEHGSSLRTKIEGIDGTVPSTDTRIQSSEEFVLGENLFTMSCTDKMTRWTIVGVQGSLLTHIINPIYLHTVVIGNRFQLGNLRSSLIERVETIRGIPAPFAFVEPVLAGTSQSISNGTKGSWIPISPIISVCCVNGWSKPEKIESTNGKLLEDGSSSSLCKRTFFQRFTSLVSKNPGWLPLVENGNVSYGALKTAAVKFGETNELLMASLVDGGFGHWVKKPEEQDLFKIHDEY